MRRLTLIAFLALAAAGCRHGEAERISQTAPATIGNPEHGAQLIRSYGCGGCHTISGIPNADGKVGPPLDGVASRIYVAGMLRTSPDNMAEWIQHPQKIVPGNVMPDMGINKADAQDITAYLYTKK